MNYTIATGVSPGLPLADISPALDLWAIAPFAVLALVLTAPALTLASIALLRGRRVRAVAAVVHGDRLSIQRDYDRAKVQHPLSRGVYRAARQGTATAGAFIADTLRADERLLGRIATLEHAALVVGAGVCAAKIIAALGLIGSAPFEKVGSAIGLGLYGTVVAAAVYVLLLVVGRWAGAHVDRLDEELRITADLAAEFHLKRHYRGKPREPRATSTDRSATAVNGDDVFVDAVVPRERRVPVATFDAADITVIDAEPPLDANEDESPREAPSRVRHDPADAARAYRPSFDDVMV